MRESRTVSISIGRDWQQVYESVWRPRDFQRWASGLSQSEMELENSGCWKAQGPEGPIKIRFSAFNAFGVMDHYVRLGNEMEIYIPMRVVANGDGAEVLFTLFREPDMTDENFGADVAWVERDLQALKRLIEGSD